MTERVAAALEERRRAAASRDRDPAGAAETLRAAAAALSLETHPVEFGLANYDLAGLLLEGDAPTDVLEAAAQAAARALLVFDPQELPDLFAGASERLGLAQWRAGRRDDAQRTFAQTAGALGGLQRHALQARLLGNMARLLGSMARLLGRAAGADDGIRVGDALGAFDTAVEVARRAESTALLASLLNDSGRLIASSRGPDGAPGTDAALTRFDEAAALVDDNDLGAALPVHGNRAAAYGLRERAIGTRICGKRFPVTSGRCICRAWRRIPPTPRGSTGPWGRPGRNGRAGIASRTCGRRTARWSRRSSACQTTRIAASGRRCGNERGLAQAEMSQRGIPGATSAAVKLFGRD